MEDIILIAVIGLILGIAVGAIYRSKKAGKKGIGCPDSGSCGSCSGSCGGCNCGK